MKLRFYLVSVCLCLVLAACSSTKIAYSFLDWALNWQIEKYVKLNADQDKYAKKAIDEFHQWHRSTQLELYADYISELKGRLTSGNISAEQIHAETDQVQLFMDASIEKLLPILVHIAGSLSDEQTDELQDSLKRERDKYKKKYVEVTTKKVLKLRRKELKKHLTRLVGSLTRSQETALETWAKDLKPYEALTFKQQQTWATQVDIAMQQRGDRDKLETQMRKLMFYHAENWGEETENLIDYNQAVTYRFIASVFNSMTNKQKAHLEKTLDGYVRDFNALASLNE